MPAPRLDGYLDSEGGMRRGARILLYLTALAGSVLAGCSVIAQPEARDATKPTSTRARATTGLEGARGSPTPSAVPPLAEKRALVVGSSSVRGSFGRIIADDLERWGFQVTRQGIVSAGLARPDFRDLREVVDSLPIDQNTAAVFLYVGMNDGQAIWLRPSERERGGERWLPWGDARWDEVYLRRARSLFRSICRRGARRAFVVLPIEVDKASLERKLQRIRRLQQRAARATSCAMAVSTAGENGQFVRRGRRLRLRDGFHMTPYGARRVWNRVQRRAFHLGDLPPALEPLTAAEGGSGDYSTK